jgi:YegS/Rv2252/BmrU family lipid kinase
MTETDSGRPRRVAFVVNPHAGVRRSAYRDIKEFCSRIFNGDQTVEIHLTQNPGDAEEIARHFAQMGFDCVAAVGGDGTASETARGLVGSQTALTIVPYGSGNGLARGLSVPLDHEEAVRLIAGAAYRQIDVGEVIDGEDRRLFFGIAGTGYDAFIAHLFNFTGRHRGFLRYILLSITSYNRYTPVPMHVRLNDKDLFARPFLLAVANTREYGNGARIAPRAVPDDGFLEVCIMQDMTLMRGILQAWKLFAGTIERVPGVTMHRTSLLDILPEAPIWYHLDGEPFRTSNRLTFRVLPRQLRVLVPLKAPATVATPSVS